MMIFAAAFIRVEEQRTDDELVCRYADGVSFRLENENTADAPMYYWGVYIRRRPLFVDDETDSPLPKENNI